MHNDSAELFFGAGSRSASFDWNIAGNLSGTSPNVLSELEWKDLGIYELKALYAGRVGSVYLKAGLSVGLITDGENRDSDYSGDDRTLEFSRSENSGSDGNTLDWSVGVGYIVLGRPVEIAPVIGYSWNYQYLTIKDGNQVIPATGPFPGLDTTYDASWSGPWAGVDVRYRGKAASLYGSFEYHLADYSAEADWNLRSDFAHPVSFRHFADGRGVVISAAGDYTITQRWAAGLMLDWQEWKAEDGVDRTFFANGAVADTRLNEVNWSSSGVFVFLRYVLR